MISPTRWYHPCRSGDFRLVRAAPDKTTLVVENPTPAERHALGKLLRTAQERAWLPAGADIALPAAGLATFDLAAPIGLCGPLVSKALHGDATTWTAIRHEDVDGVPKIVLITEPGALDADPEPPSVDPGTCPTCGAPSGLDCRSARGLPRAPHKTRKLLRVEPSPVAVPQGEAPAVVAAVTLPPPQRGCPAPESAARRASEVLRDFTAPHQWATWIAEGWMRLIGSHTGAQYFLFHRDEAASRGLSHCLIEARTNDAVCCWDERVPPEEEALGIKLAVEHREDWLRGLPRGPSRLSDLAGRPRMEWHDGGRVIPTHEA